MMVNEEFMKNLEEMDPVRREQMMALMKAISSPPERILDLLDRVGIPWERKHVDGKSCLVARWDDISAGEQRNQEQGPILKRLLEDNAFQANPGESATGSQFEGEKEPSTGFPGSMKVEPKDEVAQ